MKTDCASSEPNDIPARIAAVAFLGALLFYALNPGVLLVVGCSTNPLAFPLLWPPSETPCTPSYFVHTFVFAGVVAGLTYLAYATTEKKHE